MADRGVRQHSLHVGLHNGQDRADHQREHGQHEHDRAPVARIGGKGDDEHAQQSGESGGLGGRSHESRNGRGRSLVHVG